MRILLACCLILPMFSAAGQDNGADDQDIKKPKREVIRAQNAWKPRVRKIAAQLKSGKQDQIVTARETLRQIQDVHALPALMSLLEMVSAKDRELVFDAIRQQSGDHSTLAIGLIAVLDRSALRNTAIEELRQRDFEDVRPLIARYILFANRDTKLNAAEVAAALDDINYVPFLINSLTTLESKNYTSGGYSGIGSRYYVESQLKGCRLLLAQKGLRGFTRVSNAGVNSVYHRFEKYYVPVRRHSLRSRVQNEPVLEALRTLTGEDLGFDKLAWRSWWAKKRVALAQLADESIEPGEQEAEAITNPG